ncbi:hypothetical protein ACWCW7_29685 [Nocardia tengchongensis]
MQLLVDNPTRVWKEHEISAALRQLPGRRLSHGTVTAAVRELSKNPTTRVLDLGLEVYRCAPPEHDVTPTVEMVVEHLDLDRDRHRERRVDAKQVRDELEARGWQSPDNADLLVHAALHQLAHQLDSGVRPWICESYTILPATTGLDGTRR